MEDIINENKTEFNDLFEELNIFINDNKKYKDELLESKNLFFNITGKIGENDDEYTNRMNSFLLWFIFDWNISPSKQSLFDVYLDSLKKNNKLDIYKSLLVHKDHIHTLFSFIKIKNGTAIIKDLFSKNKYIIEDYSYFIGVNKGTIFESRLFKFNEKYNLSNYIILHPINAKNDILKAIKIVKKNNLNKKDFFNKLHSFHTKWKRYRNINLKSIYHFDSSVPG